MKALAFNQEKALVGAFSVIVQPHQLIDLRHYSGHRHREGLTELVSLYHSATPAPTALRDGLIYFDIKVITHSQIQRQTSI